jgi:hypothetical protein
MKPIALLLLTSSLLIAAPGAQAQQTDACQNRYGACMDHCSGRPASLQESCSNSCESQSNLCYGTLYGSGGPEAIQATPAPEPEASAANDEAKPAKNKKKKKTK